MPIMPSKQAKSKKKLAAKRMPIRGAKTMVKRASAVERATEMVLRDPCTGPIVHIHPGEAGSILRLAQDITVNTVAGQTAGYVVFWPGANLYVSGGNASSSVAFTPLSFPGPGATMLSTTARKARANAGCIQVLPSGISMTNMTGEIATGVLSADTITTTSSFSVDQVFQLLTRRETLAKIQFEQIWKPGITDQTYATAASANDGTFSVSNPEDANVIVIAFRGYPAGVGLSMRLTSVLEYTPRAGLGIAGSQATTAVPYGNAINVTAKMDALAVQGE